MDKFLRKALAPFIFVLTLFIIFEEWLWIKLSRLTRWIAQWWVFIKLEAFIRTLPAWASLIVLCTPSIIIFPFKILALYLIVHEHPYLGVISILLAKILGTAILARLFALTKEQVLTVAWFFYLYIKINQLISWARKWLESQPIYVQLRTVMSDFKLKVKEFLRPH